MRSSPILRAGLALASIATTVLTAGCTTTPPRPHEPGAIAFVVGGRNNMPRPQLVQQARGMLDEAVLSNDSLFIIGVSGRPQVLYSESIANRCDSKLACDATLASYRKGMGELLDKVAAKAPEADTLQAISLAARAVQGVANHGPKRIVVIDNGLQTAGAMQLQDPVIADPTTLTARLDAAGELPDLSGMQIVLTGLGAGAPPPQSATTGQLAYLERFWKTILTAGGASTITIDSTPLTNIPPAPDLPTVSVVDLDTVQGCHRLTDAELGFRPDTATLQDEAAAKRILEPIAKQITARGTAVTVAVTAAAPEADPANPLSTARAVRMLELLVELGTPRNLLTANGVGTRFSGYRAIDPNTPQARQNRLVILQPAGATCL
jgi:flagellar motor protein MotB